MYLASDSFFNLKKTQGSNTCARTLFELGQSHYVDPPWKMHVISGARLPGLILEIKSMLAGNVNHDHVTLMVGWAASDWSDCFGHGGTNNPEAVRNNFTELCMLMSQSPRSVIMLIGTAAEWRLDDRYDEWMEICRDEAAIFGILTHNLMTVIPKMKKHISAWGVVDQWHFASSDENKGIQADMVLLLLQTIELLRPSE
jgi:hypothetical protein